MLNLKKLLTNLCEKIGAIGTVYTAAWTATSTSASNTILTNTLTVPAGTYLFIVLTPSASANITVSVAGRYLQLLSLGSAVLPYQTNGGGFTVRSAQSATVTFSNLERGSFMAIKIA